MRRNIQRAAVVSEGGSRRCRRDRGVARHLLGAILCLAVAAALPPTSALAQVEDIKIAVDGLTCNLCAIGLERSLRMVPGIASAQVALASETARVTLEADAVLDLNALRAAVARAGQEVRSVECRLNGVVQRREDRYSLRRERGPSLPVSSSTAARAEAYVGKAVSVRARASFIARSPAELELIEVAVRRGSVPRPSMAAERP